MIYVFIPQGCDLVLKLHLKSLTFCEFVFEAADLSIIVFASAFL